MKVKIVFLFFLPFLAISPIIEAQDIFSVKSLSVYKNGQSFVVKEGHVNAIEKRVKIDNLPNALFGTYWFTNDNGSIANVTSELEIVDGKKDKKTSSIVELLYANKGKTISVYTQDKQSFSGVLEDFDLSEEKVNLQDSPLENPTATITLNVGGKWVSLKPSTIDRVEFTDKPNMTITTNTPEQKPVVTIHFKEKGNHAIRMMYLQEGLSWTPVYKLELLNDQEGKLSLQAEVNNQTEDIKGVDVDFVMGVPSFSSANSTATLLNFDKTQSLYNKRERISGTLQVFSNANIGRGDRNGDLNGIDSKKGGTATAESEDLYYYTIKGMTLPKGGSANLPVFEKTVSLKHVYECDLPNSFFSDYRAQELQGANTKIASEEKQSMANHYIEITNNTGEPLTSGPMLILTDSKKALAQSTIYFTPKGNNAQVYITNSPDIYIKDTEEIIGEKLSDKSIKGYDYALLTIRGTITVNNTKAKDIELTLNKSIPGKLQHSAVKCKTNIDSRKDDTGESQKLSFSTSIKANAQQKIEYTYQMYSRQY